MITLAQTIGQLRRIRDGERFTATRVGSLGCLVRLEAADNLQALDAAINLLEGMARLPAPETPAPGDSCAGLPASPQGNSGNTSNRDSA